jgi:hypothetical protein
MKLWALIAGLAALALAGGAAAAGYKAPRDPWGHPDLNGTWTTNFSGSLEAIPGVPLTVSEAQSKIIAQKIADELDTYAAFAIDPEVSGIAHEAAKNGLPLVKGERRSREVVEPADGVIPFTPAARRQVEFVQHALKTMSDPPFPANNPEERPSWERCLSGMGQPPIATMNETLPRQIVQTSDHVVIRSEYGGDMRIIPVTDRHGPAWRTDPLGDAIGRWEGETLVVETIRMPARDALRPAPPLLVPPTAKVEERFTRVGPKELLYQFTITDPSAYTGPWLAEYSLYATSRPVQEFACHEGNYSLPSILRAARAREREAAAARK